MSRAFWLKLFIRFVLAKSGVPQGLALVYRGTRITESPIGRIAAAQFIVALLISFLCLTLDRAAMISAAIAGIVCVVPSLYVWLVSRRPLATGSTGMGLVIRSELGKYALLVSLMAVAFVYYKPLNVVVFFATLAFLQFCALVVPLLEARKLLKPYR